MEKSQSKNRLKRQQIDELVKTLKSRFVKNPQRHLGVSWEDILKNLDENHEKLWSLNEMEITGG